MIFFLPKKKKNKSSWRRRRRRRRWWSRRRCVETLNVLRLNNHFVANAFNINELCEWFRKERKTNANAIKKSCVSWKQFRSRYSMDNIQLNGSNINNVAHTVSQTEQRNAYISTFTLNCRASTSTNAHTKQESEQTNDRRSLSSAQCERKMWRRQQARIIHHK